jgi:hypothetical protein
MRALALALMASSLILPLGLEAQTCSAFSNHAQAKQSYRSGNFRLDRDGDGVPCENLYRRGGRRRSSGSVTRSRNGVSRSAVRTDGVPSGASPVVPRPGDENRPYSTTPGCSLLSIYDARRVAKGERVDLSGYGCQIIFNPESKIGDRPNTGR